jgi:hypothetical protein
LVISFPCFFLCRSCRLLWRNLVLHSFNMSQRNFINFMISSLYRVMLFLVCYYSPAFSFFCGSTYLSFNRPIKYCDEFVSSVAIV